MEKTKVLELLELSAYVCDEATLMQVLHQHGEDRVLEALRRLQEATEDWKELCRGAGVKIEDELDSW